ncbi:hypothetical protein NCLIV_004290 [Neospora caninum Liverpool]|uniref:RRM domain-containing protein n=1 Tax=Neospora caninum (strain Liverpool) TaxID=572307 RepID=F0V8A4_NEOCL|nr:hypothetical protein NCLIV_004290 [Neospora caninum Liverpool]CBZ49945.1 hypothetical protein NCLIV_004290 [Neospora caninum Liverpool]|eukprot:XP_003879980.1 hypothetical protein NCLIV_004290 [Neospora caninum Liverpool]
MRHSGVWPSRTKRAALFAENEKQTTLTRFEELAKFLELAAASQRFPVTEPRRKNAFYSPVATSETLCGKECGLNSSEADHREEEARQREEDEGGEAQSLYTPEPRPRDRVQQKDANTEWQEKINRVIDTGKDRPMTEAMRQKLAKAREKRVFIASLKLPVSEEELRAVFQSFGEIKNVYFPPVDSDRKRTTYALMDFDTVEAARVLDTVPACMHPSGENGEGSGLTTADVQPHKFHF